MGNGVVVPNLCSLINCDCAETKTVIYTDGGKADSSTYIFGRLTSGPDFGYAYRIALSENQRIARKQEDFNSLGEHMCIMLTSANYSNVLVAVLSMAPAAGDLNKRTALYASGRRVELARVENLISVLPALR
jgi:hypothetical protein